MKVSELLAFEQRMRDERGLKRAPFCDALGISQAKLRRHERENADSDIGDRTLALACAALDAGLEAMGSKENGNS